MSLVFVSGLALANDPYSNREGIFKGLLYNWDSKFEIRTQQGGTQILEEKEPV